MTFHYNASMNTVRIKHRKVINLLGSISVTVKYVVWIVCKSL